VDVEELLKDAWAAVQKAGVPEPLQGVALKEAIDYLRQATGDHNGQPLPRPQSQRQSSRKRGSSRKGKTREEPTGELPDEATFFSKLASESGLEEKVLRDVLQLKEGTVHVIPPTRMLGTSKAEQTRRVIALVAGSHAHGLDRSPVDAEAVRVETKRKKCFDTANFAAILKKLKGFSPGSTRSEIMVGSKWIEEFKEAVEAAAGSNTPGD
jgi:hypothetical protein